MRISVAESFALVVYLASSNIHVAHATISEGITTQIPESYTTSTIPQIAHATSTVVSVMNFVGARALSVLQTVGDLLVRLRRVVFVKPTTFTAYAARYNVQAIELLVSLQRMAQGRA